MKQIPTTKGKTILVDDEDFLRVSRFRWHAHRNAQGQWYAKRHACVNDRIETKNKTIKLHRFILNAPNGIEVDHRNGNGLDNRKENLRLATKSQNQVNTGKRRNNTSGFKGVHQKSATRWCAALNFQGRKVHVGYFETSEEAARAYDVAVKQRQGEFAYLNFPEEQTR